MNCDKLELCGARNESLVRVVVIIVTKNVDVSYESSCRDFLEYCSMI